MIKKSYGNGLYLLETNAGSKMWRYRYRFNQKEQLLSLGVYPLISLETAIQRRDELRNILAKGINPSTKRKYVALSFWEIKN